MLSENNDSTGTKNWYQQIHARLLSNDPIAPAELVERLLNSLIEQLRKKFPDQQTSDLLYDAATDALMEYIKVPSKFDPSKRGLFGYLLMAAKGDLLNAMSKKARRERQEISISDVELHGPAGNIRSSRPPIDNLIDAKKASQEIDKLFDNSEDKQMAYLILKGERSTEAYVDILRIHSMPIDEQRREVKRNKDRIKKRIERFKEKSCGRK